MTIASCFLAAAGAANSEQREVKTPYYSIALTPDGTAIESLSVDSLGKGDFRPNVLFAPDVKSSSQAAVPANPDSSSGWRFKFSKKSFEMVSTYRPGAPEQPIALRFNPEQSHATLLALVDGGQAHLPALLHLPEQGSLRIEAESREPIFLQYEAHRRPKGYILVLFPGANQSNPRVAYTLTVVAIYPHIAGIESDSRYDGFRRDWLNIFQMQAEDGVLANNSASDPCAFVQHMYSEVAQYTPPLARGLTAMDLVRASLDKYLAGFPAYGLPGYHMFDAGGSGLTGYKTPTADSYPSMLVAAGDYVTTTHDTAWLAKNYAGLRAWAEAMLATDTNGDGLIKAADTGNSGSWDSRAGSEMLRPSNWWDTIGFGYEDAYANALAYRALEDMVAMATLASRPADAERYSQRAEKLRAAYLPTFFDPEAGILAGWRSEDGRLHDYWFPWVNGAAIVYGLVPEKLGNAIYDQLLEKVKEVGYTNFELGLPGNLIPIRREDYASPSARWGAPQNEDGSDGFQIYENGGATASFAYYTIAGFYKLGRLQDGDRILLPMLIGFKQGGFEGRGPNGRTYDWKAWDGTPNGYEGFLADSFMALAAVMQRPVAADTATKQGPNELPQSGDPADQTNRKH